jgi:hypothetical protein
MFQFQQLTLTDADTDRLAELGDAVEVDGDLPAALRPLPADERDDSDAPLRLGAVGLALGSGLAAWLEYGLLRRRLRHRTGVVPALGEAVGRLIPATAVATIATALAVIVVGELPNVLAAAVVAIVGGASFVATSIVTGVPEARTLARGLGRPEA